VHISALQTAIKHTAADAAQARQSARDEQMLGYASDDLDDGAEDDGGADGAGAASSAHFFPSPAASSSASAKRREGRSGAPGSAPRPNSGSRGRLSPLRKGADRSESPPSSSGAGIGLAGQPIRGGQPAAGRGGSGAAKAPTGGALSPLDRSASSSQLHADGPSDSQRSAKSAGASGLAAALDAALANSRAKANR